MKFLPGSFFQRHHLEVARDLIGTVLQWGPCSGIVVETEAYAAAGDEACHTASRPSTRKFMETNPAGAAYVYLNYGMYWLTNVLVKGGGSGGGDGIILIRALEPLHGIPRMKRRRGRENLTDLCSGPGKLSMALGIRGGHHGERLAARERSGKQTRGFTFRPPALENPDIVTDTRIGISKARELPWRFLLRDCPHVSVPPGKGAASHGSTLSNL